MLCPFQHLQTLTLYLIFLLPTVKSVSFKKTHFVTTDTSIIYEGAAVPSVGVIEFNSDTFRCQVGRATYAEKVHLWNSKTKTLTDFVSHFSFLFDNQEQKSSAASLAFFLAPVDFPIPTNSAAGFLGLFNSTTSASPKNQVVHVEFDSLSNSEWDPPFQHVGININSLSSANYTAWNVSPHDRDPADVWITYNATTKNLSVSWKYQNTSSHENSRLSYIIDLREVLPEWVRIGFTVATREVMERHVLQSWEFNSTLEINGKHGNKDKKRIIVVVIAASVGALAMVVVIGVGFLWRRKPVRRMMGENVNLTSINDDLERGAGPRKFSYRDLVSATNNFSSDRKLGEGGFGAVYRGYLLTLDMAVAVKKISRGSKQGRKEYVTEVKIISQLRHRNLVQLIGWCHDKDEFVLVYEFMPNGSLDSHLFGRSASLTWAVRYRIAVGLASALLYLHEEWEQCVVHRDVKSSNIMLDSSFNVKLGDFGLARLVDHELGPRTTGLAGTLGYMAPEYISTGRASKESDVYSFGVVALEIATGRKAVDPIEDKPEMSLVEWIWDLYGSRNLLLAADARLQRDFDENQMECLMIVGLWCAHPDHSLRPPIRQAIHVLNFESPLPNLPQNMPVPLYHIPTAQVSSTEPLVTNSGIDVGF